MLVRGSGAGSILFLYRNLPTLVLGKHQNVAEEVDLDAARESGVRIARRISGGGTVYHDSGNLNIALISPYNESHHNDYRYFLNPLINALSSFGISASINNRNSLVMPDGLKISGSAQFVSRGRMLSHATLLINADLEHLNLLLRSTTRVIRSSAVESVRSKVRNIGLLLPTGVGEAELLQELAASFGGDSTASKSVDETTRAAALELARTKYSTWDWIVGRSPEFSMVNASHNEEVVVKNGMIQGGLDDGKRFSPWIGTENSLTDRDRV